MQPLDKLIDKLAENIIHFEKTKNNISTSSIGWQIAHTSKVIARVVTALSTADKNLYVKKFSVLKYIILTTGKIPRGKGKAPKASLPEGEITLASLKENILKAKEKLALLNNIDNDNYFPHPLFGDLKLKEAKRFLTVHTNHHLKIINDILK
jgi:hypothetical protein